MPVMDGLEFLRQLPGACSGPQVVVLSMQGAEPIVQSALSAGARAYVLKSDAARDLAAAVSAVADGRMFFTTSIATAMVAAYTAGTSQLRPEPRSPLTPRETQVLRSVADGKSNKEIATQLGISVRTVETHRGNILEKLDLHSVSDLVLYAVRSGLCDPARAEAGSWKPNADPPRLQV
jgi:DNA-binding NarL/FixJ family response regulator